MARPARPAQQVLLERTELMAQPELLVLLDRSARLVLPARPELLAQPVLLGRTELMVQPVLLAPPVPQEQTERTELMAQLARPV